MEEIEKYMNIEKFYLLLIFFCAKQKYFYYKLIITS